MASEVRREVEGSKGQSSLLALDDRTTAKPKQQMGVKQAEHLSSEPNTKRRS